jgi:AP2-like factor (ANT lineage)
MANGPDNRSARQPKGRAKGKQVYLGGYAREEEAARAYDKAAIKYWGANANLNFPRADYASAETEIAGTATAQFVAQLRRGSTGFSRGASRFRGVTRHHQHGRWEARIGRVLGNRYLYLGTFASEEEAARAYDVAALRHRGPKAVTNFARESYYGNETPDQTTEADEDPAVSGRRETAVLESVVRACVSVGTARHHAESVSGNLAFDAFEEPLEGEVVA